MPDRVPVVIMIGQSNMNFAELPLTAARNIAAKGGLIVHYAANGAPLSAALDRGGGDWSAADTPGAGEHLDALTARLDAILTPGSPAYIPGSYLAGSIWVQGEADSASQLAAADYQENLIELRDTLVEQYGDHEWAVAALSGDVWEFRQSGLNREAAWMTVRDGQLGLDQVPGFDVVDTDALAGDLGLDAEGMFRGDYVHYSDAFGGELGGALAEQLDFAGDVNLQVGTSGNDSFEVGPGRVQQVFGSAGTDIADFSALGHGIRVTEYERQTAAVETLNGNSPFEANLYQVERVVGTDFDDRFRLGDYVRYVRAGDGDDTVVGSDLGDAIRLDAGDDRALGMGGNDILQGYAGDDLLAGQDGDDRLYGGAGDDLILAGRGDDLIRGGRGDDVIRPHQGEDRIEMTRGDNGADTIYGFSARDDILSFEGTGTVLDDLFLSIEESDLRIQVENDSVDADIRIINGAKFFADEDDLETPGWILV